jgi:hypothetical protein
MSQLSTPISRSCNRLSTHKKTSDPIHSNLAENKSLVHTCHAQPQIHNFDIHSPSTTFHSPLLPATHSSMHLAVSPTNHTAANSPTRANAVFVPCSLHEVTS